MTASEKFTGSNPK
jgi:hypothetical protein